MKSSNDYIEKINQVLASKKNADIYIINDKLTLSVFSILEKSLKNVRRIYLIIRDNPHLPKEKVAREFEMNPNDTLYNEYDIIEKNELTHFAKAKAMHDFIKNHVEIRRLNPRAKMGINILIIDEDFMITGTTSLELSESHSERNINFNTTIDSNMDQEQITTFKNEFERIWLSEQITTDYKDELLKSLSFVYKEELLQMGCYCAMVSGSGKPRTTLPVNANMRKGFDFNKILTCFSPLSKHANIPTNEQITVLIGTDCISEGQNLQDCDTVINYDIQWNPVTLIQRFGRIDRIGSTNSQIKLINFFPAVELNEYLGLESRVKKKMIQSNIVSTGDDNLLEPEMNDISFRTKQMEKLKNEVIDIDDAADTISITDLNMNQYIYELSQYIKVQPELLQVPRGIYSIAKPNEIGLNKDGVLFCFKYKNNEEKPNSDSSLFPYYISFVTDEGEIEYNSTQARELLKRFRGLCYGKDKVNMELVNAFLKETKQTKDMSKYSKLLSKVVDSIQAVEEDNAGFSLFDFGGFKNDFANKTSDDFELVSFIIVRKEV